VNDETKSPTTFRTSAALVELGQQPVVVIEFLLFLGTNKGPVVIPPLNLSTYLVVSPTLLFLARAFN
jgi:hypothetical protein